MYEKMIKRTLWVFRCSILGCDFQREYVEDPPKELTCPQCRSKGNTIWIEGEEESFIGVDFGT